MKNSLRQIGFWTAVSIVIANMIGTGVFTSLGFQALSVQSPFSLLTLWLIGGVFALFGSFAYGELSAALPRSGGEYNFLSVIYHPVVGFLSGWVSLLIGFAAPVALAAMALGIYSKVFLFGLDPMWIAIGVVVLLTIIHSLQIKVGSSFQVAATSLKVILIAFFVFAGFIFGSAQPVSFLPTDMFTSDLLNPGFAVSLVYVTYAYSGWNASTYIAGEIENPQKNLPLSLFWGTLLVTVLYLLLNFIFLYTAPIPELQGQVEVGAISAKYIFGETGGKVISGIISILLISTISSMVFAGPRVTKVIGEDLNIFRLFSRVSSNQIPVYAIAFQSVISIIFIATSTFDAVLTYVGFTLNLFTLLTVVGVFVLRYRQPNLPRPYRTWGYPVTPIIFAAINIWVLYFLLVNKTTESLIGLATVAAGLVVYFAANGGSLTPKNLPASNQK